MSIVLAIETSTANCAVSIVGDGINYSQAEYAPQQHAQLMLPMVQQALQTTGLQPQQIDALAFGEGPGAFTGLRIAAGLVQGLALGWNKPVIAVSTLSALAYQGFMYNGNLSWWACLDARMGEFYTQYCEFDVNGVLINASDAQLLPAKPLQTQKLGQYGIGDIQSSYPDLVAEFSVWIDDVPNAQSVAILALAQMDKAQTLQQSIPQPIYLRPSVAS